MRGKLLKMRQPKADSRNNPRVRRVAENEWQLNRLEQFRNNVKFAAAAKSYRTAMGVTQREVANRFGIQAQSVTAWESGCYFGWTEERLADYTRIVNSIASGTRSRAVAR